MTKQIIVAIIVVSSALTGTRSSPQVSAQASAKGSPVASKAQTAPVDPASMPLFNVTLVQLKPDMVVAWREFQEKETIPMLRKAGVRERRVFQTVIGPAFEFGTMTPAAGLAERDGQSPVVKALGEEGARAYGERLRRFVASQRTLVLRLRTDLSWVPDANAKLPVAVLSNYSIAAGRTADFESYLRTEMMPAHKKLNTGGYSVYQTQFGGDPTFYVASLMPNYAEIDKGPAITRALGPSGAARAQQKLAGVVAHVERVVVHEVAELSLAGRQISDNR